MLSLDQVEARKAGGETENHPAMRVGNKRFYQKPFLSLKYDCSGHIDNEKEGKKMANKANSLAHYKVVVQIPHCIHNQSIEEKIIYNQYRASIQEIIKRLCKYKGSRNLGGTYDARSRPSVIEYPAKISVSSFMGYLKGKSALMIF